MNKILFFILIPTLLLSQSYKDSKTVVYYWKCNLLASKLTDRSGNNNNATQTTSSKQAVYSKRCLTFDGSDDYYILSDTLDLGKNITATIMFRLNQATITASAYQCMTGVYSSAGAGINDSPFYIHSNPAVGIVYMHDGAESKGRGIGTWIANTWYTITTRKTGTDYDLYWSTTIASFDSVINGVFSANNNIEFDAIGTLNNVYGAFDLRAVIIDTTSRSASYISNLHDYLIDLSCNDQRGYLQYSGRYLKYLGW